MATSTTVPAVIAALIAAATAHAQTTLYSQAPDFSVPGAGLPSHNDIPGTPNRLYRADNFIPSQSDTINQIRWWGNNHGGHYQDLSNLSGFTIQIWTGFTEPDQLLYSETFDLASTNPAASGLVSQFNGATIYGHTVNLAGSVAVQAGTAYCLAVIANQTDALDEWYWHDNGPVDFLPGQAEYLYNFDMWVPSFLPWGRAFEVINIPAPSSAVLLAGAALTACGRRRSCRR